MTAVDFLTNADLRQSARQEFNASAEFSAKSIDAAYDPNGYVEIGGCGCGAH